MSVDLPVISCQSCKALIPRALERCPLCGARNCPQRAALNRRCPSCGSIYPSSLASCPCCRPASGTPLQASQHLEILEVHHSIAHKGQTDTIINWLVGLFNGAGALTFDLTLNFCDGEEKTLSGAVMRDIRMTYRQSLKVGGTHKIANDALLTVKHTRITIENMRYD